MPKCINQKKLGLKKPQLSFCLTTVMGFWGCFTTMEQLMVTIVRAPSDPNCNVKSVKHRSWIAVQWGWLWTTGLGGLCGSASPELCLWGQLYPSLWSHRTSTSHQCSSHQPENVRPFAQIPAASFSVTCCPSHGMGCVPPALMQKCQPQSGQVPTCPSTPPLCRAKGHLYPAAVCDAENGCQEIGNIFLY